MEFSKTRGVKQAKCIDSAPKLPQNCIKTGRMTLSSNHFLQNFFQDLKKYKTASFKLKKQPIFSQKRSSRIITVMGSKFVPEQLIFSSVFGCREPRARKEQSEWRARGFGD